VNFEPVNAYDNLLDLLEGEAGHYRALLSVIEGEKRAIVASNLGQLGNAGKEKEELFLKIQMLEEQRQILIEDLAKYLGCSPRDLTIGKLAELVKEPHSARFKSLCSDLLPLAKTIRDLNGANEVLLRHSIELIRSSFAFLNSLVATNPVYYRSGKMQQNDRSGKVLCASI